MKSPRRQPAEWAEHEAVWIGWPSAADLWEDNLDPAQAEVAELIGAICFPDPGDEKGDRMRGERIDLLVRGDDARVTAEAMRLGLADPTLVRLHDAPIGDIWLRDTGPIFVEDATSGPIASAFRFNGWGEKYLLGDDDRISGIVAEKAGARLRRFDDLIAEGGALEVDGEGTCITTRQCLLNKNRNPGLSEKDIDGVLREAIGAEKVIWLDEGMIGDHTDGHVDNLARFIAPGKIACMKPTGKDDPNAKIFEAIRKTLEAATDAKGRKLEVIELPSPGRAKRDGKIVPASHLNFYIANHSLVMPSYGGLTGEDETALECLEILEQHVDRPHFYAIELFAPFVRRRVLPLHQPATAETSLSDDPSRETDLAELAPIRKTGVSEAEARRRLETEGYNELPRGGRRSILKVVGEVVREPMLSLLIAGGVIYFLIGDRTEASMLLVFASLSIIITVVQETRTERVIEALRDLTSPRALVIRDGERKRIAGREVVRGDLVVLGEGDRVPADATLIEATHLQSDESLLTGESVAVDKDVGGRVFSGSLIVRGAATVEVFATGGASEIGKIGATLEALRFEPPRMQVEMRRLVRIFGVAAAAASITAILLYGFLRGGWLDALLAGIALGMSLLPEEFPVVLAVFMAMGAWRISRARVLTRKAAAIESLGAATVLCTDKTGTLTENRMSVEELRSADGEEWRRSTAGDAALSPTLRALAQIAVLASAPDPFDPMEKAIHQLSADAPPDAGERTLVRTYGLQPDLLAVTQAWRRPDLTVEIASKGAPEAIIGLCGLDSDRRQDILRAVDEMANKGLRVLALARARP